MAKKKLRKLSLTPAAVAARHRRLIAREEDRRIDDILEKHFRKGATPWNDFDYPRSADDDAMPVTEAPAPAVASLEDTIFSDDVMHDAGIPSDANAVLHWPYVTIDDIVGVLHSDYLHGEGPRTEKSEITDCFDEASPDPEMTIEERIASGVEPAVRRDRSEVVAEMVRRRNAPRGFTDPRVNEADPPAYSVASQDAAKMRELITQDQERNRQFLVTENGKARECLTECAKVIADAIVRGASIIAGDPEPEDLTDKMFAEVDERPWSLVGPGMPLNCWLETTRAGEGGRYDPPAQRTQACQAILRAVGDEIEWVERTTGVTTVTHSTFLPPTHWRWPASEGLTTTRLDTLDGLRRAGYDCEMRK